MKAIKYLIFFLLVLLTGCGLAGVRDVKNVREAKLMPEEVAKKVLNPYFGESWVLNPRGHELLGWCDTEYYLPYTSIKQIVVSKYGSNINKLITVSNWSINQISAFLPRFCGVTISYRVELNTPLTEDQINDILDAFVSLGAKIKEVKRE